MTGQADHVAGHQSMTLPPTWPWVVLLLALGAGYAFVLWHHPAAKCWPPWRAISWYLGLTIAALALIGPIVDVAHADFRVHMLGHLLLGMLAPILLVLGAPVTLALRALSVAQAR